LSSASITASSGKNSVWIALSSLTLIKKLFQMLNITLVPAHRELGWPIVVCQAVMQKKFPWHYSIGILQAMNLIRPLKVDIHFRFTARSFIVFPVSVDIGFTDKSAVADNSKRPYSLAFAGPHEEKVVARLRNRRFEISDTPVARALWEFLAITFIGERRFLRIPSKEVSRHRSETLS